MMPPVRPIEDMRMPADTKDMTDDTMACGCESGSCYCDTIDRDWDAYEDRKFGADFDCCDARDCDGYPL
jgi:hypothetical protein